MTISLHEFLVHLRENPALRVTVILILGAIFVNGGTDAPNAIASIVATGGMRLKAAVRMAAVCNLAGLLVMTACSSKVAFTIYYMVDFGGNPAKAMIALCAALTAIIVWAAAAWCFGIPTSESHALIAGLSGAAVAIHGGMGGINGDEWIKVLYGLLLSVVMGFVSGLLCGKAVKLWTVNLGTADKRRRAGRHMTMVQAAGAAAMAFMHGAQDGQKFMGVFLLGIFIAEREIAGRDFSIPLWMMILCSLVMAAGTAIGGGKIIKKVGSDMVKLKKAQGIAADAAAAFCLLLFSLIGVPVSTTHVKTTAIMGAGAAENTAEVNMSVVREMFLAWMITFPCCGAIGYLTVRLYMQIIQIF